MITKFGNSSGPQPLLRGPQVLPQKSNLMLRAESWFYSIFMDICLSFILIIESHEYKVLNHRHYCLQLDGPSWRWGLLNICEGRLLWEPISTSEHWCCSAVSDIHLIQMSAMCRHMFLSCFLCVNEQTFCTCTNT